MAGRPRKQKNGCARDVNQRMFKEGRWEDYCLRRMQLQRDGVDRKVIWRICCHLLPPLDGSRPECVLPVELEPIVAKYKDNLPEIPPQPIPGHGEGFIQQGAGLAGLNHTETNDKFVADIKRAKVDWKSEWQMLADHVDAERYAAEVEVVRWVFNNAGKQPSQIRPVDVPSLGALRYLEHVCSSPIHYADFVKTNWSKMLPDKKTLEHESRFASEGHKTTRLLDDFLESLDIWQEAEEDAGHRTVQHG